MKVSSDYDHRVDFSKYKTFDLLNGAKSNISSINQDRIYNSVKAEMQGKGFTQDTKQPDLKVNITAIVRNEQEVSSNTNYYGYGGAARPYYWGTGMSSSYTTYDVEHYKSGSLIIDVVDASTDKLVWQGVGDKKIDDPGSDADQRIAEAVNKIMQGFPPKPGK
jgi:hypothetical protein